MANRLFELPETKGTFQVKGIINGTEKEKFYTAKKTKNGKDFRAVNFGCEYDTMKSVYLNLNGMPQDKVYFSRRNAETGKTETKAVPWANRNTFAEADFRMIGTNLGLTKTINAEGKTVNDKKTMHAFDACEYIKKNLKDEMSTFVKGNVEFSSYIDTEGNVRRSVKYIPTQISLCKDVDFDEYDETNKPSHDFTQTILYMGIDKETVDEKDTGRFVVSAKVVTYSDIVDAEFFIADSKLACLFKKNLKPYNAISVHGKIVVSHNIQATSEEDAWGETNTMNTVKSNSTTEMVITGATPSTIDKETYNEKNVSAAIKAIKNAKTAEQNFSGKSKNIDITVDEDWGSDDWGSSAADDEDTPW